MLFIAITILILVHEWGHFYAARLLRVKVEEFGFGFPPRIFSRVKNGIRYSINALPLGGFVKIFGEQGEGKGLQESFTSRPAYQRLFILAAGVLMNMVLAWVLFSLGAWIGAPEASDDPNSLLPVSIINILPHSPAEQKGLRFGDQILEMRADAISLRVEQEKDVSDFVDGFRGEEIIMVIKRGESIQEILITPRAQAPEGEGPLGISMGRLTISRVQWYEAPWVGLKTLVQTLMGILGGLGYLLKELLLQGRTGAAVSGPVGIYFFGRDVQALGIHYILQFVGMLSANLAVLNVLPIPALDGGRIFFILIEKIRGARINPEVEARAHTIGFALLILLMVVVTYKDIVNIF